ncbi:hypothetical protein JADG_008246 [Aureobasidium aubasidani]|nr:hypothetical protein JADG_008246 [Aureobasidium pullulans]
MKSLYITMQASAAAILLLLLRRLETLTIHINSVLTGGEEHGQIIPEIFNALQDKSLVRLNISFAMEVQTNVTAEMLDPLRASTNLKRLLITHNFLEMENISLHHVLPVSSPIKSLHRGEGLHIEFELDIVLSIDDVGGGGNGHQQRGNIDQQHNQIKKQALSTMSFYADHYDFSRSTPISITITPIAFATPLTPLTPSSPNPYPLDADGDVVMCDSIDYDPDTDTPMPDAPPPTSIPIPTTPSSPPKPPTKPKPKIKLTLAKKPTVSDTGSPAPKSPTSAAAKSPTKSTARKSRGSKSGKSGKSGSSTALSPIAESPTKPVKGMERYYRGYATVLCRAQDWALLTTPPIYCAKPSCSKHLNPSSGQISPTIDNNISCPDCQTQTCTACKMLSHDGPCQPDTVREQLLALKYAPCPICGNMIELIAGCQVMTCVEPCNRKFRYLCHRLLNKCRGTCEASWAFAMERAD